LESFDKLVAEFLKADQDKYDDFIAKAEETMNVVEEKDQLIAKMYVSTMKKIKEKGVEFVSSETARVNKLLNEKVSDAKKAMFKSRLDILASFTDYLKKAKDEL
jgi:endoplasmic reticulum protein 29